MRYNDYTTCNGGNLVMECRKKIEKYREGIIVQTVGKLEDPLDGETMMETEAVHKQNFYEFEKMLRERWPGMLPIGAGCCTKSKTRNPDGQ